jgi:VWFA-related protein
MPVDPDGDGKRKNAAEADKPHSIARVDVVVTDMEGRPVPGLTAADFSLETDGKARTVQSCEFHSDEPLRLVVILDDLGLNLDQSNRARRALRAFVNSALRPGDEMAVLKTSEGAGAFDRLSSDRDEIEAGIDRARFHPLSAAAASDSFAVGTVGALRAVLEGLRELPGRKAVLLISTGLRQRVPTPPARTAHRASAVVYGVDLGAKPSVAQLDEGVAAIVKETGGTIVDGEAERALQRIVADQSAHYLLTFSADDAGFDYIARAPRVGRVAVRVDRLQTTARARSGVFGVAEEAEGEGYHEVEREFERAIDSELLHGDLHVRVTPMLAMGGSWQIESVAHLEARDLTFVKTVDGRYRTSLDTALALYDESGEAVKDTVRSLDANLTEKAFLEAQRQGFDFTVVLGAPKPGAYQARVVVRDVLSGRMGSARRFIRADGWQGGKLAITSITLRGQSEKNEDGSETVREFEEAPSMRRFAPGHRLSYRFNLFNFGIDKEKGGEVSTVTEVWRDGVRVYAGDSKSFHFEPDAAAGGRAISGVIALGKDMAPGFYWLKVEVTDRIAPRTVTQWMDFEVHP